MISIMNGAVQQHGIEVENLIKREIINDSSLLSSWTSEFDVPSNMSSYGVPVSIKTCALRSKDSVVGLGDARRIWSNVSTQNFVMLIATYHQADASKIFSVIHEINITPKCAKTLLGDLSLKEVSIFHDGLKTFKTGEHRQARQWAKEHKKCLLDKLGLIQLNQKVDSKAQRRLQCSVRLSNLLDACEHRVHTETFKEMTLPFSIFSARRTFR